MLEAERALYDAHRDEWLAEHRGDFVLVKRDRLIGFFEEEGEALAEGARQFGLASFLVREVQEKEAEVFIPALTFGLLRKDAEKLLESITSDPLVVGGQPVVRGTRITVDQVIGLLGSGVSWQEIGDDLRLTDRDIRACVAFAREALERP